MSPERRNPVISSPEVHQLLQQLHTLSEAQESSWARPYFYASRYLRFYVFGETWGVASNDLMRDKFVALEKDKCHFIYLLARSMDVRNVVEAGTSFGVSTMYLALAVGQNVGVARKLGRGDVEGKVIATEKEPSKAARAREHWKKAGEEVEPWIELREGDLLKTLNVNEGMPKEVDMLLLDIWTPLALPTLKIIQPRLRRGAVVIADNTAKFRALYKDLLDYLQDPGNGFRNLVVPFSKGLEIAVYLPGE